MYFAQLFNISRHKQVENTWELISNEQLIGQSNNQDPRYEFKVFNKQELTKRIKLIFHIDKEIELEYNSDGNGEYLITWYIHDEEYNLIRNKLRIKIYSLVLNNFEN